MSDSESNGIEPTRGVWLFFGRFGVGMGFGLLLDGAGSWVGLRWLGGVVSWPPAAGDDNTRTFGASAEEGAHPPHHCLCADRRRCANDCASHAQIRTLPVPMGAPLNSTMGVNAAPPSPKHSAALTTSSKRKST